MKNINRFSLFSQPIFFSNFFTPALKGEVAENQAPFRVGVKLIFSMTSFRSRQWAFLILLLISCSPAKRLEHLVSRHPELRLPDTLIVRDTLISPAVQSDTTLHIEQLYDTVILEKERLRVKLLRIRDTLWVEGTCNPDTIYYEKQIPVEKIKLIKEPFNLKPVLWLLGALIILIMILYLVKRL